MIWSFVDLYKLKFNLEKEAPPASLDDKGKL